MKEVSHLVEAAQAGDSEAYAALVQRFQGMAYAIASRYVGDYHLAQDLVQEAIIEAFDEAEIPAIPLLRWWNTLIGCLAQRGKSTSIQ